MPKAFLNGIDIYYEVHGSGFPVLLLHGFAGTTAMWQGQAAAFTSRYMFISYDMRGHGQSDAPRGPNLYSSDIAVEDQCQLLRHLGVPQAVVGGLSLGGVVAQRFALAHPEMVRALVLADTGPGFRNPERLAAWAKECEERALILEQEGMEGFMRSPYSADDYYTPPEIMRRLDPIGLANVARQVMGPMPLLPIDRIQVPTLVLCGTKDEPLVAASKYMVNKMANAFLCFIPNAGHGSNIDQPELFNRLVLEWLAELGV
ncbi:MAG: alpha/beta fold hydrolase [Dehalococcoidia bacterium]